MTLMNQKLLPICLVVLAAISVAGCTLAGPPNTGPGRQVGWYAYLGGDDIRQACVPGADEHLRFVYQATFAAQVRGYELVVPAGAGSGGLRSQAWGAPALMSFGPGGPGLGGPVEARSVVDGGDLSALAAALEESRFDRPPPVGARLRSDRYFWTVAACRNGSFHFNAFLLDLDDPRQPAFATFLFSLDRTGVAVRPPEPVGGPLRTLDPARASPERREDLSFDLRVGPEGLDTAPW